MTLSVSLMLLTFQPSRSARVQRQPTSKTANMWLRSIVTAKHQCPLRTTLQRYVTSTFIRTSFIIILLIFIRIVWMSSTRTLLWMPTMCLPRLVDAVTKAIDSFIAKVKDIKFKAKIDNANIEKLTDDRKKLIGDESKLLEDHRKENKEILTRHFYDMSNMMSRNEGVWLSNGWVKALLWIFLPCFLYTVISIVYLVASYIDK